MIQRIAMRLLTIVLLMAHLTAFSQLPDSSEVTTRPHQKKWMPALVVPSVLVGCGLLTMNDNGPFYNSYNAYEDIQNRVPGFHTHVDNYLIYVPGAAVYGLNLAGIKGKSNFMDRSMIFLIAQFTATVSFLAIKNESHVLRPDSSDYLSFPSGHTTLAFVSATFLFEEYREMSIWYGIAGYSIATATGVVRMLNNRHWMSDVFVGAGLGIFTTELTYLVYPHLKNFVNTRIFSKRHNNVEILPYYSQDYIGLFFCLKIN